MNLVLALRAEQDIDLARAYYAARGGMGLARRFRAALLRTVDAILEHPGRGTIVAIPLLAVGECRRSLLASPFQSHSVYYTVGEKTVTLLRVLHVSRDLRDMT